jgi:hypothetical protein
VKQAWSGAISGEGLSLEHGFGDGDGHVFEPDEYLPCQVPGLWARNSIIRTLCCATLGF